MSDAAHHAAGGGEHEAGAGGGGQSSSPSKVRQLQMENAALIDGLRALNEQVSALEAQRRMALEREREREHWIASMLTERGQGEGGGTAGHAGLDGRGLERLDPDPMRPAATARVPGAGGDAHPDLVLQQKTPHRAQRSARPVAVGDGAGACVDTSAGGGGGRADKVGGGAADPPGVPAGDLDPLRLFGATMESWRVNELTPDKERAREHERDRQRESARRREMERDKEGETRRQKWKMALLRDRMRNTFSGRAVDHDPSPIRPHPLEPTRSFSVPKGASGNGDKASSGVCAESTGISAAAEDAGRESPPHSPAARAAPPEELTIPPWEQWAAERQKQNLAQQVASHRATSLHTCSTSQSRISSSSSSDSSVELIRRERRDAGARAASEGQIARPGRVDAGNGIHDARVKGDMHSLRVTSSPSIKYPSEPKEASQKAGKSSPRDPAAVHDRVCEQQLEGQELQGAKDGWGYGKPAVRLSKTIKSYEVFGIGLDLVLETERIKVAVAKDVRDERNQGINHLINSNDILVAVDGVDIRLLPGQSVIEGLIWGPRNSLVSLTLQSADSNNTFHEIVAVRHTRMSITDKPELALMLSGSHATHLVSHISVVNTLNTMRRCLVDADGELLNLFSPLLPWDDKKILLESVAQRKRKHLVQRVGIDHWDQANDGVYWNLGLVFDTVCDSKAPDNEWFSSLTNINQWASNSKPAKIRQVLKGSPAAGCNLEKGDIVLKVDGIKAYAHNVCTLLRSCGRGANDGSAGRQGEGIAMKSVLIVQKGAELVEVKVVRTGAENMRRVEHILGLLEMVGREEGTIELAAAGKGDGESMKRQLVDDLRRAIIHHEHYRQADEYQHAQRLEQIHQRMVLLINEIAENLYPPPTPLPDLRGECKQLRQQVSDLEAELTANRCEVFSLQHLSLVRKEMVLKKIVAHMKDRLLSSVWESWRASVLQKKAVWKVLSTVVMKWRCSGMSAAFLKWRCTSATAHQLREKGRKVVLRMRNRTVVLALERWREKSAQQSSLRLRATQFLRHWVNASNCALNATVFEAWLSVWRKRKAIRKAVGRWLGNKLVCFLFEWRQLVREESLDRKQDDVHDLLRRVKAAEEAAAELHQQLTSANQDKEVLGNCMNHLLKERNFLCTFKQLLAFAHQSAHAPERTPTRTQTEATPKTPVNASANIKRPGPLKMAWSASPKVRNTGRRGRSPPGGITSLSTSSSQESKGHTGLLQGLPEKKEVNSSAPPSPSHSPPSPSPNSSISHSEEEGNQTRHLNKKEGTEENGIASRKSVSPPSHAETWELQSRCAKTRAGEQAENPSRECPGEHGSTGEQDGRGMVRVGGGDEVAIHAGASSPTETSGTYTGASTKKKKPKFELQRFDDDICELFTSLRRR